MWTARSGSRMHEGDYHAYLYRHKHGINPRSGGAPPPLGRAGFAARDSGVAPQKLSCAKVITREELRQASGRPFGRGAALSTQATLGCLPGLRHRPPERSHCCGVSAREEARDNGRELIETRFVNHPRAITQGRMPVVAAAADTCALCYTDRTGPGSQRRMSARLRSSRPLQTARQPFSRRKTGLRKKKLRYPFTTRRPTASHRPPAALNATLCRSD